MREWYFITKNRKKKGEDDLKLLSYIFTIDFSW